VKLDQTYIAYEYVVSTTYMYVAFLYVYTIITLCGGCKD